MDDRTNALKRLLFRMADDALVIAHRNSEWTGLGPLLEEDIAFSSIAQDKLGHALALYTILESLGEGDPDQLAFNRPASSFTCCRLVELPIGEYDFSLVRHFLFDNAEAVRYEALAGSTYEPLARLARKVRGEIKYHVFHADSWMAQLGVNGNDESRERMQSALDLAYPLSIGMFEPSDADALLVDEGIFPGEDVLRERWESVIGEKVVAAGYTLHAVHDPAVGYGGRSGRHTEFLEPLVGEMGEVFRIDPGAEW